MSPIEERMFAALCDFYPDTVTLTVGGQRRGNGGDKVKLSSEVRFDQYRVDFLMEIGRVRLAIECDGHDFHDRTKEQAAHDRARDRHLLKLGIVTARFTGSEIHRDAERCAVDAFEVLLALYDAQCGADVSIWMDAHDAGLAKAAEG